jgi:hypothetical protein
MRNFLKSEDGNMAVAFALASLPILGAVGVAVDYSRAVNVRSFVQSQADIAALSGAQLGPKGNPQLYLDHLRAATEQRFGVGSWIDGLEIDAKWTSEVDFSVGVKGGVPVSLLGAVPGFPQEVDIGVLAVVRIAEPREVYKPPVVNELDNEAGDYNQVSVYCFNPAKKKTSERRTQMTVIADNAGTTYSYTMPRCDAGEMLSFKLLNVRHVRDQPNLWSISKPRFEYFTDTQTDQNGAEKYNMSCTGDALCKSPPPQGWKILETVLCNTKEECRPKSQGGIIPEGKNRAPVQAKAGCTPGKYLYYGWEDRPPGLPGQNEAGTNWKHIAWTDQDYDDIRIVIGCPTIESVEDRLVRLTR